MAQATVEISGAIWKIRPTQLIGRDRTTYRKFYVRELNVKYPNVWGIEMWHDNVNLLDNLKEADVVTCKCVVRGRQWTNKMGFDDAIISLQCIEINKI